MTRSKKRLNLGLIAIYHFFIGLLSGGLLAAEPLLWRVEGPRPSYLFATVHSADPRVTAIAPSVLKALNACTSFHPEIELSPNLAASMASRMFSPAAPDLQTILPPPLWQRVLAAGAKLGVPEVLLHRLSPGLAALLFAAPVEQTDIMTTVDGQLYARSQSRGLTIATLETLDEQLDLFDKLKPAPALALLAQSLDDFEAGQPQIGRLLAAYLAGDESRIVDVVAEDFNDPSAKDLAEPLLYRRNHVMAARVEPDLKRAAPLWPSVPHISSGHGAASLSSAPGGSRFPGCNSPPAADGFAAAPPAAVAQVHQRDDSTKNPPRSGGGLLILAPMTRARDRLPLPSALLVSVRLQALAALVLVHLQTAFLLQVAHRYRRCGETAPCVAFSPL
jgi:uncharacterized protein YbaP (TraB family)